MKPVEIRLVGRFKFTGKVPGSHEHLLYHGLHTQTDQDIFLKGEEVKCKPSDLRLTILQEGKVLQILQGGTGIPHMHWCGQDEDYSFIVLEEFGKSFKELLEICGGKFTLKTVLMLAEEIISILQFIHFKGFCHNQINLRNLLMGVGQQCLKLHIVDFGAASRYKDNISSEHISDRWVNDRASDPTSINLEFSSIRLNKGEPVSRRDDLQSLFYLMLYLLKGELPWSHIIRISKRSESERVRQVLKIKTEITAELLFQGYPELQMLYRYTLSIPFAQKPRYMYYRNVFQQKIEKLGYLNDKIYDWLLVNDPEVMADPDVRFEIIPNEEEFIRQLNEEIEAKEKQNTDRMERNKSPKQEMGGSLSPRKKECIIY